MRLAFLVDSLYTFGGVQRVTQVIATALMHAGHDITIVTLDAADASHESPFTIVPFAYPGTPHRKWQLCKCFSALYRKVLPHTRFTSRLYAHSSFPSEKRLALAHTLQQGHYDAIVGVHAPLAVRLAACRPLLPGVRLIGWVHNSYEALFGKDSLYIGPELRHHYDYQLSLLDATVVLSHFDAQRYTFSPRVIYNPLTLEPARQSAGTSHKFLAVGRFSRRHKGFDLLIRAFHIFAQTDSTWTLDIVGEGEEEDLYRQLISEYHLEQRVHLHPFTPDISQYYADAQVYVLSSRWEGFGLVLVEAMAHGLPVVSSDLPTSREIMGDYALYFPVDDVLALASQLQAATRLDWPSKSAAAPAIVRRFSIDTILRHWQEILE